MSLAQLRQQRRAQLAPLPPSDDGSAAAPATPISVRSAEPTPAPAARPAAASRPAVGGARLDSLLSSLIANAPQVPTEAPRVTSASPAPDLETARPTEAARPAGRFPWKFVLGVAGAGLMAVVALAGVRGLGARFAGPSRLPDGSPAFSAPTTAVDAWLAANPNGGPTL